LLADGVDLEPSLAKPTEFRDSGLHFLTEAMGT